MTETFIRVPVGPLREWLLRQHRRRTWAEMAARVGVHPTRLGQLCRSDESRVDLSTVQRLLNALDPQTSIADLYPDVLVPVPNRGDDDESEYGGSGQG